MRLLIGCARQRDRAAAQTLHGKREVGQGRVVGQGFTQNHQRARVQRGQCATVFGGHAVAQPAVGTQAAYPFPAGGAVVGFIDLLCSGPVHQIMGQRPMGVVEKRQFQVGQWGPCNVGMGMFKSNHGVPAQSPSKTGRRLAENASKARRKSCVCMQMAWAWASASIAWSSVMAHSWCSMVLVMP